MKNEEHKLQCACVQWFRTQYPEHIIFAIPNRGARNITTGAALKREGVLRGVADLCILAPNSDYHALFVEIKTTSGRQSEHQQRFERKVRARGYQYIICRSFFDFFQQ